MVSFILSLICFQDSIDANTLLHTDKQSKNNVEIDDNAKIEDIGGPDKVINAFWPEVIGENVEGKVLSSQVAQHLGRKYYQFELEPPHIFITATAAGNRLYLFAVSGKGLQWKRYYKELRQIAESFRVV